MSKIPKKAAKYKFIAITLSVFFIALILSTNAKAKDTISLGEAIVTVDYNGKPPVDSDLDGLTDQAEEQIYKTDPKNNDSDGDGYYDGVEIMSQSDPLDPEVIPGLPSIGVSTINGTQIETPWPWYASRAFAIVGFILLYVSIFLGLTIRMPIFRKLFAPLYALQGHGWIALQATLFALIHGLLLMFDKFIHFRLADVFVPFSTSFKPAIVALGIVGFYLMVILTVSSYARKYMSHKLWRGLHFTNIILYFFVIFHSYMLGTDMRIPLIGNIFIVANALLIIMMIANMFMRIKADIVKRKSSNQTPSEQSMI